MHTKEALNRLGRFHAISIQYLAFITFINVVENRGSFQKRGLTNFVLSLYRFLHAAMEKPKHSAQNERYFSCFNIKETAATFISYIFWKCKVYVGERGILKPANIWYKSNLLMLGIS